MCYNESYWYLHDVVVSERYQASSSEFLKKLNEQGLLFESKEECEAYHRHRKDLLDLAECIAKQNEGVDFAKKRDIDMKKEKLKSAFKQSEPHKAISKLVIQKQFVQWSKPDAHGVCTCDIGNYFKAVFVENKGRLFVKTNTVKFIDCKGISLGEATEIVNKWIDGFVKIKS